jgi:2,3-bisphosphoglycerate-independent phosphoglycerate mutase
VIKDKELTMSDNHHLVGGGELAEALRDLYALGQSDYSFEPVILVDRQGKLLGRIHDGDAVIFCLRRGEREVQLTEAFVDPGVGGFPRAGFQNLPFVILTLYHEKFKDLPVAFAPTQIQHTLAETISQANLRQLHISESEKFAHVTFFFNGGTNQPFHGEKDLNVPSQRDAAPELCPELRLAEVTQQVEDGMKEGYELIIVNFANGDVIGHTQSTDAKILCAQALDHYLQQVVQAALPAGYTVLITADHGNLEELFNTDGSPNVSHTANPVPFFLVAPNNSKPVEYSKGKLADVAPTILSIMGIAPPAEMTGKCVIAESCNLKAKNVLLVILDGWGIGRQDETNPIYTAQTPFWDSLTQSYPHTQLEAAGEAVGLKAGKNGNSEAGHMNLGAGRVIEQDDVRLDAAMQDGSFYSNPILHNTIREVMDRHSCLHLICLLSEKSSHGSIDYPLAVLRMAKEQGLRDVYLHVIFDGRSTEPGSAPQLLQKFETKIREIGIGKIVTGFGRGIALDRDGNYQKTRRAYDALVYGTGKHHRVAWD